MPHNVFNYEAFLFVVMYTATVLHLRFDCN